MHRYRDLIFPRLRGKYPEGGMGASHQGGARNPPPTSRGSAAIRFPRKRGKISNHRRQ